MITMVLGGLWHGAAWGFVLWGALHGTCLVVEHQLRGRDLRAPAWLRWAIVFNVVVFGWILFRAADLELAGRVHRAARRVRPGDAVDARDRARRVAVIGFQLLPPAPLERVRLRFAQLPRPRSAPAWRRHRRRRRHRAGRRVPPFIYFQF